MIKFHGISMPEGAALSWPLSDIVIRRKNGFDFRCRVRGCSLLDQRPVSALCSRWLTTQRMGEDAPKLPFAPAVMGGWVMGWTPPDGICVPR